MKTALPRHAARSRLTIGEAGPSASARAASSGGRLRRPAADQHAARCASQDLCSGGAPRRYSPSMEEQVIAAEPIAHMAAPEEVGEAVVWLCSEAASFVTDLLMAVDGGWVAQ